MTTPSPLVPMNTGELLDRTFSLYRNNFLLFAGIMLFPSLFMFAAGLFTTLAGKNPILAGVGALVSVYAFVIAWALAGAATIFAVSDVHLGRPSGIGLAYRRLRGKAFRLIWLMFLQGLVVMGGFVLLIVPGIIFFLRCTLSLAACVLENLKARAAIRRSWQLSKGSMGRIFLVLLVSFGVGWTAGAIFQTPFAIMTAMAGSKGESSLLLAVLNQLGGAIAQILAGPVGSISLALVYYDERVRKEAFDLQLMMAALEEQPAAALPASGAAATG